MQQSRLKKQKKINFYLDAINLSLQCCKSFLVTQRSISFFQLFNKGSNKKNTKKYNFFERMKFLFNQGDRNLFKISPQTRRLEMC